MIKSILFGILIFFSGLICSCSNGNSVPNANKFNYQSGDLTIDSSAVVPLKNGVSGIATVIVHNNSSHTIQNITYQLENNLNQQNTKQDGSCGNLNAYASCSMTISVPKNFKQEQYTLSTRVTASYLDSGNQPHQFSNLINFQYLADNTPPGIYISPVTLTGFGVNTSRGIAYIYAVGDSDYYIESMALSSPGFRIVSGDISGHHLFAGHRVAVEIEGATPQKLAQIELQLKYKVATKEYQQQAKLGILGSDDTSLWSVSLEPLINAESLTNGSAYFQNVSNGDIVVSSLKSNSSDIVLNDSSCLGYPDNKIPSGGICKVTFNVQPNVSKLQTGNIILTSNDNQASIDISWYNGTPGGGVILTIPDAINNLLILKEGQESKIKITAYNPGGFTESGELLTPIIYGGSLIAETPLPLDPKCNMTALASCDYQDSVKDNQSEINPNLFEFNYQGSYFVDQQTRKSVTGRKLLAYQTIDKTPNLSITLPYEPFQLTVIGDGKHTQQAILKINNIGDVAARFNTIEMQKTPDSGEDILGFFSIDSSECTLNVLPSGKSCSVYISFANINRPDFEEGKVKLVVDSYGNTKPLSQDIPYQILPASFGLSASFANLSGMEQSGDKYIINGSTAQNKSIRWILSNNGNDQTLQAIEFSNLSPDVWNIDNTATDACFKGDNISQAQQLFNFKLAAGKSCSITFNNIYGKSAPITEAGIKSTNLYFPRLRIKYNSSFIWLYPPLSDSGDSIGPNVKFANQQGFLNISTKIINDGVPDSYLELAYQLDNGDDYKTFQFSATLPRSIVEDEGSSASGPCNISPEGDSGSATALLKVDCTLGAGVVPLIESIPLSQLMLKESDYNIPLYFANNLDSNIILGVTEFATNIHAKQINDK